MPGVQNARKGAGGPSPGAARAPHGPHLRGEILGRHEQHLLRLVARPVVQAHDLAHAEVDKLEQRRPTHYLARVLVVQERPQHPSMFGTMASWNNTE